MRDDAPRRRAAAASVRYWIGVASREHVRLGRRGGFAQFAHGKPGPAKRPSEGDWVIYYSSRERYRDPAPCQKFTALGRVMDAAPVRVTQAPGFAPYRRKVKYERTQDVDIRPLITRLTFIKNKSRWGSVFRFGFLEIPAADFRKIAARMRRKPPTR
jgi:predicted RNA-binding protein